MHPLQDLTHIARQFRHLQAEHEREGPEGSWRRRQGARLEDLEHRFETLLERWVRDPEQRERWHAHLYHGASIPGLGAADVLIFKGASPQGSRLEIRRNEAGERSVFVDGSRVDHFAVEQPLASPLRFGESEYAEIFDSRPEAVNALREFLHTASREPPWSCAAELYEDGIIDENFSLTSRGHRLLASLSS